MTLQGKSAVITGSTGGIGLAIARALAREGANILINGFGQPVEIEEVRRSIERDYSMEALYSPADMSKPDEIVAMVRQAEEAFGSVDVLVNNAGIPYVAAVEEFSPEKWDAIIAINLSAAFPADSPDRECAARPARPHLLHGHGCAAATADRDPQGTVHRRGRGREPRGPL